MRGYPAHDIYVGTTEIVVVDSDGVYREPRDWELERFATECGANDEAISDAGR